MNIVARVRRHDVTADPSLVSVFFSFASGGRRLPGWTAERGVLLLGWLRAVVLAVCCWEDRRRRCCWGGGFCVVGSVGAGGTAGEGELVRCGRWRCSGGWLLWVKKKSKSARRGEDRGSVGCCGGKWGCCVVG